MVNTSSIRAVPISRDAYAPYGSLIAADEALPFRYANMRTAKRFDFLAEIADRKSVV